MTPIDYKDYKKKYLKYKTKYFKLKGGLVGINIDDYNRLNDKPAIFHELYGIDIPFNNNLSDRDNHLNISAVPTDDHKLIPKINLDNTVNKTYHQNHEEYFYNHVLINNIFRYAFEPKYTNSGNTDFQILKNTFKSINKIYLLDYQNIVGQMHIYRSKIITDINNQHTNISNIIPLLTTLQSISNQILSVLPIIQNMHGNILINECHVILSSYEIAQYNIHKIVELINEINRLDTIDMIQNRIREHTTKLETEKSLYDQTNNLYREKEKEYDSYVDEFRKATKIKDKGRITKADLNINKIEKQKKKLEEKREEHRKIISDSNKYINHLEEKLIKIDDLNKQLVYLKATLISPPQTIDINDNDKILSSQEGLKDYYLEKINTINPLIQNLTAYTQTIQQIQTTLNDTNQYIITNLNIDFNIHTITKLIDILRHNNNYITFLTTNNKLLNRKNKFYDKYPDDTHASAFEVAFTIIRHNIDALSSGRKNLYILCGHRHPNFQADIENDMNDALKIFYNCFSRSTFGEFDITNIVSIQSEFKKHGRGLDVYADSNSFDDFMFWILGISISSFIHGCFVHNPENFVRYIEADGMRNLNDIINISDTKNIPPRLILLTNDTQKLNDITKGGIKNLYSELVLVYKNIHINTGKFDYKIYVNGYENKYLNICMYDLLTVLIDPINHDNLPDKFSVHGHSRLNRCVQNRPDSKLNLGEIIQQNTNINNLTNNIKEFIQSDCTVFEKFMVFVKYLQQIYFGAIHDSEQLNEYAIQLNTLEKFFTNQNI